RGGAASTSRDAVEAAFDPFSPALREAEDGGRDGSAAHGDAGGDGEQPTAEGGETKLPRPLFALGALAPDDGGGDAEQSGKDAQSVEAGVSLPLTAGRVVESE